MGTTRTPLLEPKLTTRLPPGLLSLRQRLDPTPSGATPRAGCAHPATRPSSPSSAGQRTPAPSRTSLGPSEAWQTTSSAAIRPASGTPPQLSQRLTGRTSQRNQIATRPTTSGQTPINRPALWTSGPRLSDRPIRRSMPIIRTVRATRPDQRTFSSPITLPHLRLRAGPGVNIPATRPRRPRATSRLTKTVTWAMSNRRRVNPL